MKTKARTFWGKPSNSLWKPFSKSKPIKPAIRKGSVNRLFSDLDRDGVANVFDCQPRNPRKQDVKWKNSEEFSNRRFDTIKRTIRLPPQKVLEILKSQEEHTIDLPQERFERQLKRGYPIKQLKESMERGDVIPRPSISFAERFDENNPNEWSGAHGEGRHRTLAAKELGEKEIEVDIMEDDLIDEK